MEGELRLVEPEPARSFADWIGLECRQRHLQGSVRFPVTALLGEGGQQSPGVQLRPDQPLGAAAAPRSA
ncbi:hypothetical protein [Streptomyces chartreusis]|uniref:hypothetical protein n=1 Tax=Streptomyces chartreusis TaxID=1969 RepID=UPI0013318D43|nr:hypothetical protein [Streptomyces chartreusis]